MNIYIHLVYHNAYTQSDCNVIVVDFIPVPGMKSMETSWWILAGFTMKFEKECCVYILSYYYCLLHTKSLFAVCHQFVKYTKLLTKADNLISS